MEGIGVLHGEFTYTDESGSRTGLITELGLDLVDHERIAVVGACVFPYQLDRCFLMGHAKDHGRTVAVVKAGQSIVDRLVTAGFHPEAAGQHNGKQDFLSVDPIHFFTDDLFDLLGHTAGRWEQAENTVCHLFDITASHHQCMAVHYAVGRTLFKPFSHQILYFHVGFKPLSTIKALS